MERTEIIKALECCLKTETLGDCKATKCPALTKNGCYFYLRTAEDHDHALCNEQIKTAISIIKELSEKNKNLEQAYECADSARREISSKCDELIEENERLKGAK